MTDLDKLKAEMEAKRAAYDAAAYADADAAYAAAAYADADAAYEAALAAQEKEQSDD